jgi:hypothetical protein
VNKFKNKNFELNILSFRSWKRIEERKKRGLNWN